LIDFVTWYKHDVFISNLLLNVWMTMALARSTSRAHSLLYALVISITIWIIVTTISHVQLDGHELIIEHPLVGLEEFKESFSSTHAALESSSSSSAKKTNNISSGLISDAFRNASAAITAKTTLQASEYSNNSTRCNVCYTLQDFQRCVPPHKRKNLTGSCATRIESWSDIQKCLNGPRDHRKRSTVPVKEDLQVHLIGERNSGTKWIVEEMKKCFPREKYGLVFQRDLNGRNKHFFQNSFGVYGSFQRKHIVIAAFREPVEWVAAMIEKPYHMIEHQKGFDKDDNPIPLDWQEFVSKPWAMKNRSKADYKLLEEKKKNPRKVLSCRIIGMEFHEVMPCRMDSGSLPHRLARSQNPVYELKRGGSKLVEGEPYANILELRSDKIVNFLLEVPLLQDLGGYLAVRFEDLVQNGTRAFLEQVGAMLGLPELPPECQPQEPRPEMVGRRKIPDGLRQWVEDHLVLRTERLLGYR
jgi:hypothetical protein